MEKSSEAPITETKDWKDSETAVAQFIAALDPDAVVKHDIYLPDKDTGHPRQRDVWIEARLCRIFPVKVLVSCKKWSRKLSEQDIDAFVGELRSSGAHKGVIYSFSGYTRQAIEKAQILGICCCKLYNNQPPDIPESLLLSVYCCRPTFRIGFVEKLDPVWDLETFDDLFALRVPIEGDEISFIDYLVEVYREGEEAALGEMVEHRRFPQPWKRIVELHAGEEPYPVLRVIIDGNWKVYQGLLEAYLLEGSYSFTESQFVGSQCSPVLDVRGSDPGPGWRLVEDPPAELEPNVGMLVLAKGDIRSAAIEQLGSTKIQDLA